MEGLKIGLTFIFGPSFFVLPWRVMPAGAIRLDANMLGIVIRTGAVPFRDGASDPE
jgi:hypothetical protein